MLTKNKNKQWEKILYEKQTDDDAYINPKFMKEYIDVPRVYLGYINAFIPFLDAAYVISILA